MELVVNGDTLPGPVTAELIRNSIHSLTGDGDSFAILASGPQFYIQTSGGPANGFVLEYRAGSEAEHYSCSNSELTADQIAWAFESYFAEDDSWKTELQWQPQVFDYSGGSSGFGAWLIGLGVAVIAFLAWKFFIAT